MKLTTLFALSLGLSLGTAVAEEYEDVTYSGLYLAPGLSEENGVISGWHDAEKTKENEADDNMCYAASAANLLAWWYNNSGKAVASDAPTELNAIWSTFVNNNQSFADGGIAHCAINWWISGVYAPCYQQDDKSWGVVPESDPMWDRNYLTTRDFGDDVEDAEGIPVTLPNYKKDGADFGGYYYDQYGLTKENLTDFLCEVWSYVAPATPDAPDAEANVSITLAPLASEEVLGTASICDVDFVDLFEYSVISLGISSEEGNLGHAITLWGVEYDADGNLTTLWLTDSDDDTNQIFSVAATLDADANKIYFGELVGEGEDAYYFSEAYKNYKGVYIREIYALDTEEASNWKLVPEPSTATLSLLALAGLAARRRRK